MSTFDYNVIVIGGGSAGLVSSYIAGALKAKVALIEKHKMGGDCLNTGCVPSKALLRSAKMLSYARRAKEFGFNTTTVDFEFAKVMERVQRIIQDIAPHDSVDRYTKLGVDCIEGSAKIISPHRVEVNGKILKTKSIIVATGARPLIPNISGLERINYLTSDTVWNLRECPHNLVILGGGAIGAELAQAFARLGSKVTIVEMSAEILGREDSDVVQCVTARFQDEDITVLTNHTALSFREESGLKIMTCNYNGGTVDIPFDQIIIALGREANVKGFGLEELGVRLSSRRTIEANAFLETNIPHIYVCGDVTGPFQLTHMAAHQAWYASVNALFSPFKRFKVDNRIIPWSIFTDPEIARVGLNEKDARAKNIPYEVTRYGIDDLDRAIADSEAHGFIKVLTKPKTDKILGVTIVGAHASDIIPEFILAMKHNLGLNKILATIHIYPTWGEANKYAAGAWRKAHVPKIALSIIEKLMAWRRR